MEQDSLSYKTLKNSAYTFINYAFPILFSIFVTPIIVHRLGITDYGVYVLVNTIVGFLGLLDLGLSTALVKYIAEYYAKKDFSRLQTLVSSANSLFLIIGVISFLVFFVVGAFFLSAFNISATSEKHILIVFLLAGILNLIIALNSVYTVAPAALQRFDIMAKASLAQLIFFNLATLFAVMLGFKLKVILGLNILAVFGQALYLRWQCKKILPELHFGFGWDKQAIKISYRFGLMAAVSNIANGFLTQLDRLIVPIYLNPASLSYYSLPGNVAQKTSGLVGSVTGVLFPLASSVSGQGDYEKLKVIYTRVLRNITVLAAACTMAIIVFSYQILQFWLGKDFADKGATILVVLAITYFFLSILSPLVNILMGLNKIRFLAIMSTVLAVVNIALLFGLLPNFGIMGAAWAYLGATLLVPFVFRWAEKRYLNMEGRIKFYFFLYAKILFTSVVFFGLMNFIVKPYVTNLAILIVVGPLTVLFYIFLYRLFGFFDAEDWQLFMLFWGKVKLKFKF